MTSRPYGRWGLKRPSTIAGILVVLIYGSLFYAWSGCATSISPKVVESREASFDGNEQNSGVISSTEIGFIVTQNFRDKYNSLIAVYGGDFTPPLKKDAGIAPVGRSQWLITKQCMVYYLEMNAWRQSGFLPKNPP